MAGEAKAEPKIITVNKAEDLPGGVMPEGDSPEDAEKGLFDALGSEEEFAEDPAAESGKDGAEGDAESKSKDKKAEKPEETEDDESEDDPEDDDADDADDKDTESKDGDEAGKVVEYEVTLPGGEKKKVSLDELTAGYSRTEDYTRKRQRDADEHRQAMTEVREIRSQYADRLEKLKDTLTSLGPKRPDVALRKTNPGEWAAQEAEWSAFQESIGKVGNAQGAISEEEKAEKAEARQAYVDSEWEKAAAAVPEWQDPAKATTELATLRTFAMKDLHFTEAEIDSLADHRLLLMLRENFTLRNERATAVAEVERKRREASEAAGRLEPGASSARPKSKAKTKAKAQQAADERAARSGSVGDAAKAIELLLGADD